jgi:hypothetical protein
MNFFILYLRVRDSVGDIQSADAKARNGDARVNVFSQSRHLFERRHPCGSWIDVFSWRANSNSRWMRHFSSDLRERTVIFSL